MAMMIIIILATCAELHNLNTAKQTPFVRVRGHLAGATWTTCWRGGGGGGDSPRRLLLTPGAGLRKAISGELDRIKMALLQPRYCNGEIHWKLNCCD